jgi:hypothetical protein
MRHNVRPFKIEFKNRLSRSTPMRSPTGDDSGKDRATPAFLDVGVFTAGRRSHANGYGDAMKAADALFARSAPGAPAPETVPLSNAPAGRVLPSLIENGDVLAFRLAEADQKRGRSRMARKAKASSSVRPKKPTVQPESVVTQVSAEQAATEIALEAPIAAAPDRERKSIRKRRLLDKELKAGEKWKRRLCRAAR